MNIILNIDTAGSRAQVSLAKEGIVLDGLSSVSQKDHAGFLQPAISSLLQQQGLTVQQLAAVAVSAGPGSYTGLRVGMASAKGLCYALNIPLINISTLEIMAAGMQLPEEANNGNRLLCPMIDARRMEVFTALYTPALELIMPAAALLLEPGSFGNYLTDHTMYFSGSGAAKWEAVCRHENARFIPADNSPGPMATLSFKRYQSGSFTQLVDSEPIYVKEVYTTKTL